LDPFRLPAPRFSNIERYKDIAPLLASYDYDPKPLNAEIIQRDDPQPQTDFRHEIVRIDTAYGDRFDLHLLIPTDRTRPSETVVLFPGMGVWTATREFKVGKVPDWNYIEGIPASGRIVCYPEYLGAFSRWDGVRLSGKLSRSVEGRKVFIRLAQDVSRALDYLLTRDDVDADRLAYMGVSIGAYFGPIVLTFDSRFKSAILLAVGYRDMYPENPQIQPFHFTPDVKVPVLMITGTDDNIFPYEISQRPFFNDLGSENKKHVLFAAGHSLHGDSVLAEINRWLPTAYGEIAPEPDQESN
jgi:dienelactone hydrolase